MQLLQLALLEADMVAVVMEVAVVVAAKAECLWAVGQVAKWAAETVMVVVVDMAGWVAEQRPLLKTI